MNEFDVSTFQKITNELKIIISVKLKGRSLQPDHPVGTLYHAVKLISDLYKKNPDSFLEANRIVQHSTLKDDQKIAKKFGLNTDLFIKPSGLFNDGTHPDVYKNSVILACFFVSFMRSVPKDAQVTDYSYLKPVDQPVSHMFLCMVIKANDLGDSVINNDLDLESILKLVQKAIYFLCAPQSEMAHIKDNIAVHQGEIDRFSEDYVLATVIFNHTPPDQKLLNKLRLNQYLRNCEELFHVDNIESVASVVGLTELGFIST